VSSLHLLGSGRLLASSGLLASSRLLGSGALLLGNGEKREARQNRKTDRPCNQVFSSHLTAPIQPRQKSNRCPQLPFIPGRRNSSMGEARAEASMASTVARLPQSRAGRQSGVPSYLLPAARSFPNDVFGSMVAQSTVIALCGLPAQSPG
jgi:hypothetical protein